jgi:tRNA 2-thiocytidine biosynthesis protein TtcA
MANVAPSHLLDRRLFDFSAVRADGEARIEGDTAFDVDDTLEEAIERAAHPLAIRVADVRG